MLQLGKENRDTIEVQKIFNEDIKTMETGFRISDTRFTGEVKNMYDRKASDVLVHIVIFASTQSV